MVPEACYSKLHIAREYLELAMRRYMERSDYFSAIHLAGAAEELFGKWLQEEDRALNRDLKAQIAFEALETGQMSKIKEVISRRNWSRNTAKHMSDDRQINIWLDPVFEARNWIDTAVENYEKIFPPTNTMIQYWQFRHQEIVQSARTVESPNETGGGEPVTAEPIQNDPALGRRTQL
jgi:hypothetical protein